MRMPMIHFVAKYAGHGGVISQTNRGDGAFHYLILQVRVYWGVNLSVTT